MAFDIIKRTDRIMLIKLEESLLDDGLYKSLSMYFYRHLLMLLINRVFHSCVPCLRQSATPAYGVGTLSLYTPNIVHKIQTWHCQCIG